MEKVYSARYDNGNASRPFTVAVALYRDRIRIQYRNDDNEYTEVIWEKSRVRQIQYARSIVTLRYGMQQPGEQLEMTDPELISLYRQYYRVPWLKRLSHATGISGLVLVLSSLAAAVLGCYLFMLPLFADLAARAFPREYEIEMGNTVYEHILKEEKIDVVKTEVINRFFTQMHTGGAYPARITVVKKDIANAFALPGGGIVVYSHILEKMQSPEELAALLAHEYAHVDLKHATRGVFRNLAGYLFISMLFSDAGGMAQVVIENANGLRNMSYSRAMESEADEQGMQTLLNNRVDVRGMKSLFLLLKNEQEVEMNEILSTHPDLNHRMEQTDEFIKAHGNPYRRQDSMAYYFAQLRKQ